MIEDRSDTPPSWHVFTDGSCLGNPGPGGWGFVVRDDQGNTVFSDSGSEHNTTNNRMELMAAICACDYITLHRHYRPAAGPNNISILQPTRVTIWTDSRYVCDGVSQWFEGWVKRGWRSKDGKPIKNKDLWEQLGQHAQALALSWQWVKAHNGHDGNEHANTLAQEAAKHLQAQTPRSSPVRPKIYLNVPYSSKDLAKQHGARWDQHAKRWFSYDPLPDALRSFLP